MTDTEAMTIGDMTPEEYLAQGERYWSESSQSFTEIRLMPVPHALRAVAKLERKCGFDILSTPLGKALLARTEQGVDAVATDIVGFGGRKMLKDRNTGKFRGAWAKTPRRV